MTQSIHSSVKNGDDNFVLQEDIQAFIDKFQKHDAVIITALRKPYKYKLPVLQNNQALYMALFALNYPIQELDNSYIKDYKKILNLDNDFFTGSYLVVNRFNKPDFIKTMAQLATYFGQEFIFVIQGGKNPKGYLLGTAKLIPNIKQKHRIKTGQIIYFPQCYSLIGNPKFFTDHRHIQFYFTGAINDEKIGHSEMRNVFQPANWLGRWWYSSMGKKVLKEIGILCP